MRVNNKAKGRYDTFCGDCGKKIQTVKGVNLDVLFVVSGHTDKRKDYCLKHYRSHFSAEELAKMDKRHLETIKRDILGIPENFGGTAEVKV
jgi:hypothetical protein